MSVKKHLWLLICLIIGLTLLLSACSGSSNQSSKQPTDQSKTTNPSASNNKNMNKATQTSAHTKADHLVVYGDVVSEKKGCVLSSKFLPGDRIVWRINVLNPITQEQVKDAKVKVHLSTGKVIKATYKKHPTPGVKNTPHFWSGSLKVTDDMPTGKLQYYVTATAGDLKGKFEPFNVSLSYLTILEGKKKNKQQNNKKKEENNQQKGEATALAAKEIYKGSCASCHGANLEGGVGPSLKHIGSKLSKKDILTQIDEGGDIMPADLITGKKAQKVAAWLAAKK